MIEKLNTPGQRVRYARLIAGFVSRRALSEKYNLSSNTLQGWEQGKANLTKKGAAKITHLLQQEGVLCTAQWLLNGEGEPPCVLPSCDATNHKNCSSRQNYFSDYLNQEEKIIQNEVNQFRTLHPNALITRINNDALAPFYNHGDYIAGLRFNEKDTVEKCTNHFCIIEMQDGSVFPCLIKRATNDHRLFATTTNSNNRQHFCIHEMKIKSVAPVVWHRKRLKLLQQVII